MIDRVKRRTLFLVFFVIIHKAITGTPNNILPVSPLADQNLSQKDLVVVPPRVVLYPFFNQDIQSFSLLIRCASPIDKVQIRIWFPENSGNDAEFFTNNIQWKKIDNYFYLTSIYGKPAEIPVVENFFKLEVRYRYSPIKYSIASLEIVSENKVLKIIPVDFITPLQFDYYWDKIVAKIKNGDKEKAALVIVAIVLSWFFIRSRKKKKIPLCSTRARFSSLIEENQEIKIEETKNPFGCRLGGLKKRVKIAYRSSNIYVSISGKRNIFSDKDSISLDINQYWKLRIEAQNYFGDDEKSHKNLVILLLPV